MGNVAVWQYPSTHAMVICGAVPQGANHANRALGLVVPAYLLFHSSLRSHRSRPEENVSPVIEYQHSDGLVKATA
jgi:hypothetical protein